MDLSAVIFAAVAVAWAAYLVPKAIRHHDEADQSRPVDRFSQTVRVLARRDAVSARAARFVVPPRAARPAIDGGTEQNQQPDPAPEAPAPPTAAQVRARRVAARRATQRRRRVLALLLLANAAVGALAGLGVVALVWQALPAGLLAAWLVACRVMVRGEHAAWSALTTPATTEPRGAQPESEPEPEKPATPVVPDRYEVEAGDHGFDEVGPRSETTAHEAVPGGPRLWDPVPVTLPTYVQKATAVRRSVRTIDLDATGVWTSGRTDEDARIAQATAKRVAREAGGDEDRAVGS